MPQEQNTASLKAAWVSIFVTLSLIAAKLIGGLLSGSLALISLAAESGVDLFSVLLTLFAVRITTKPADKDHPYGHGKFDNLTSLFQSLILLAIAVWIFLEALGRLRHPSAVNLTIDFITFTILIGSFILDFWRSHKLGAIGRAERSQTLQTDALHFFADSLSVIVVFVGLIFSKYLNLEGADSYAALLVAGFVGTLAIKQGKRALDALTDRFAHDEDYDTVSKIIMETGGVVQVEKLRMRHSGPNLFIDATVAINRVLPFASVEHILSDIKQKIVNKFAGAEVDLHPHAVKLGHESTFETIKLITSEEGLLPHNIELSKDENGSVTLDLHLEFPPASRFSEAHAKSEVIEKHIREHLPLVKKIVIHLEEERPDYAMTVVHNVTGERTALAEEITALAQTSHPEVKGIRELTLLESEPYKELKLALTIILGKNLSLIQI